MKVKSTPASPAEGEPVKRGRPRAFEEIEALAAAMKVFWRNGYEGTSLDDLTEAMGINRPSMYATFGNKEALFRRVLDHYGTLAQKHFLEALALPTAREVFKQLMCMSVGKSCRGANRGCLLVQGAMSCGQEHESIRREVIKRRCGVESLIRDRLQRALDENDLPVGSNPAALAKYIVTMQHGLAVQASGGTSIEDLRAAAEIALHAWPSK